MKDARETLLDIMENNPNDYEAVDAILAAMPEIVGAMVKPLEWVRNGDRLHWCCNVSLSGNPSFIKVYAGTNKYNLYADGFRGCGHDYDTLESAKAAADDHHRAQVLGALGL